MYSHIEAKMATAKQHYTPGNHPNSQVNLRPREITKLGAEPRTFRISDTLRQTLLTLGAKSHGQPIDTIESMTDVLELVPYLLFTLERTYPVLRKDKEGNTIRELIDELRVMPVCRVLRKQRVFIYRGDCLYCSNEGTDPLLEALPCPVCQRDT